MAEILLSPGIAVSEIDRSAVAPRPVVAGAALLGPTVKGPVNIPTRVTSYGEYARVFGTTFVSGSDEHEFITSIAAKSYFEQGGETLLVTRIADPVAFTPQSASVYVNDGDELFHVELLSAGVQAYGSEGDSFYITVSNPNPDKGTFALTVYRGDSTEDNPVVLESWNNVSLDPSREDYIEAVIGNQKFQVVTDGSETFVQTVGDYVNKSQYLRISSVDCKMCDYYRYAEDVGWKDYIGSIGTGFSIAFEGGSGEVGKCYSGSATPVSGVVAKYFEDITSTATDYNQTVLASHYDTAISLLENTDEYQFNVISAPGLLNADEVNKLTALAQHRGDCIAVVDRCLYAANINTVTTAANTISNSYAAMYWPWLQMFSATGRQVWVPASTVIPGVYKYNDMQAAPWFAPAGMTRGGVPGVIQAERKLTKAMRDKLYEKNVNPIATMPGAGLVVYGQKTLQKKASALDRVNVRRLLIEVKKNIKDMAAGLLFEQNTVDLQESFRAQVEPYLAGIVNRNGLYSYKVDLSGNTNDAIDHNEFHCAIYLQPTKTIEYIYLTFTVSATGVEFE